MGTGSSLETRERQLQYLQAMGIQAWDLRNPAVEPPAAEQHLAEAAGMAALPGEAAIPASGYDWETLQTTVEACTLCGLHSSRTQTVFGVGSRCADWLLIGEAPGRDEDQQGEPFVGRAGQLLNAMLQAVGLHREQVYIANILKCRPPNNRDPVSQEVACCEPYLMRQIELIKPRLIVALGRIAAQNLLNTETPIGKLRGRTHQFRDTGIPLIATYHPAYLLRSPLEKRKAWEDLQLAVATLREQL
ncbi:MAG: uracil-DNA glycosylase family protein [Thiogranum sp.]